jgi:hypothetical protein
MGKYTNMTKDIFLVFGSDSWKAENIKTYPSDFTTLKSGDEFIRVTVIPSGRQAANPLQSSSGMLMVEIFTPAGSGPNRTNAIADKLDTYLVGKTFKSSESGTTQFGPSYLSGGGLDQVNPNLYRVVYTNHFNYFGVR